MIKKGDKFIVDKAKYLLWSGHVNPEQRYQEKWADKVFICTSVDKHKVWAYFGTKIFSTWLDERFLSSYIEEVIIL